MFCVVIFEYDVHGTMFCVVVFKILYDVYFSSLIFLLSPEFLVWYLLILYCLPEINQFDPLHLAKRKAAAI